MQFQSCYLLAACSAFSRNSKKKFGNIFSENAERSGASARGCF
jgi:hypothetical protein